MHLFPATIEVGDEEGFTREKDIFSRSEFGKGLVNLVTVSEDPLVILLDSPWGTGKTTFIKMWAGELRKSGFPVIYFDAFENDHVDNGFMAIAAEVIKLSQTLKKTKAPAYKKFIKKAGRLGGILLRTSARIGVKAATLGAIDAADIESLKAVADDIAKETGSKADEYVEAMLKLQSQEKDSLTALRAALADLAQSFTEPLAKEGNSEVRRPVVFIIDELDRCKPSFALELLERVKHIFSIKNVHFLLSAQLEQLENSVRFNYGNDIDALTYLQKFYNVIVRFPDAGRYRHERPISKFVKHLISTMSLDQDAMAVVRYIAEVRGLSFRTIERIATCVALARGFTPKNHLWISPIVSVLCVMKIIAPDTFRRARERKIAINEIKTFLALDQSSINIDPINTDWIIGWWNYCLATEEPDRHDSEWQQYRQFLFNDSVDRESIVPLMARCLDTFQSPSP